MSIKDVLSKKDYFSLLGVYVIVWICILVTSMYTSGLKGNYILYYGFEWGLGIVLALTLFGVVFWRR